MTDPTAAATLRRLTAAARDGTLTAPPQLLAYLDGAAAAFDATGSH